MREWFAEFARLFGRLFAVGVLVALAACLASGLWELATR